MPATASAAPPSKAMLWTGYVLSALPAIALVLSGIFKFMPSSPDLEKNLEHIGWPLVAVVPLGITELIAAILYIIPRTSVLGAILVTGYMGGAIATHARIGEMFVIQALIAVLAWLGLYFRDARLRALLPLRSAN